MTSQTLLGELMRRDRASVDPKDYPDEQFDLFSIPAFDHGSPDVVYGTQIGSAKQIVEPGDVLLSRIVPHIRRAWTVPPASRRRQIASGEWIVFRSGAVDPRYVRHFLVSDNFHARFMQTVSGVGGSLLRARPSYVAQIAVPLPPLAEQRRIADILDKADELRAKRKRTLAIHDQFGDAMFREMFGDTRVNSKGWADSSTLGDLSEIVSGVTIGRRLTGLETRVVPYLAVANVQAGFLKLTSVKQTPATEGEIVKYALQQDDLLLTEGGDPDKLGRGALWQGQLPLCLHQNHVFRVRLRTSDLTPTFLSYLLAGPRGRNYFLKAAKQTTGIASINMTQLRAFPLLVPPIGVQRKFARRLEQARATQADMKRSETALDALFASLQYRAFRGELQAPP